MNVSVAKEMPSLRTPVFSSAASTASAIMVGWSTLNSPMNAPVSTRKTNTVTMFAKPNAYISTDTRAPPMPHAIASVRDDHRRSSTGARNDAPTRPAMMPAPSRVNRPSSL